MNENERQPYEKPEVVRHGNLKEITLTSFQPAPPSKVDRSHFESDDI